MESNEYLSKNQANDLGLSKEEKKTVREKRDKLLADTDWTMMADVNMEIEKREKYVNYRQELRDITKQKDFPYNVIFPILEV